eukprot:2446667-Rhodomonas_salina.3
MKPYTGGVVECAPSVTIRPEVVPGDLRAGRQIGGGNQNQTLLSGYRPDLRMSCVPKFDHITAALLPGPSTEFSLRDHLARVLAQKPALGNGFISEQPHALSDLGVPHTNCNKVLPLNYRIVTLVMCTFFLALSVAAGRGPAFQAARLRAGLCSLPTGQARRVSVPVPIDHAKPQRSLRRRGGQ